MKNSLVNLMGTLSGGNSALHEKNYLPIKAGDAALVIEVGHASAGVVTDAVEIESHGMVRVVGWSTAANLPDCTLTSEQGVFAPDAVYGRVRPDVVEAGAARHPLVGFAIEFRYANVLPFVINFGDLRIPVGAEHASLLGQHQPEYVGLLDDETVLHRAEIYGVGPPVDWVHPDILALVLQLQSPVLDFGCGDGTLVRVLRQRGVDAYGIELDSERIRTSLKEDVSPYITLYNGQFPMPFAEGQFESVVSSEVIEHIPDYVEAIKDIARVCRSRIAITVPDMSCIPIGHRHGFVPWHLLESTHVNFFNRHSLAKLLGQSFKDLRFHQLAGGRLNGTFVPGSLGVVASRKF